MNNVKRKRTNPLAPLCPVHHVAMLVGRVIGPKQYRYCSIADCNGSVQTERTFPRATAVLLAKRPRRPRGRPRRK